MGPFSRPALPSCCATRRQDFKRGSDPSGIISIKDHVVEGAASPLEFGCVARDTCRVSFPAAVGCLVPNIRAPAASAGTSGRTNSRLTTRAWLAAGSPLSALSRSAVSSCTLGCSVTGTLEQLRRVSISPRVCFVAAIAEWTTKELIIFGRICGFPEECLSWLQAQGYDGQAFGRLKSPSHLASKGYSGRSDTVWTLLNGLRTPAVHDWLNRFSAFCQKNAAERQLENAEMLCLIRLGKGLELMNLLQQDDDAPAPAPAPTYSAPAPQVYAPAPAPVPAPQYDYGGYDEDDDGPVADDV